MLQHREKFCVVWRELLGDLSKHPRSLCDDAAWAELLLLPVNAEWLRKTLRALEPGKLQQTVLLRMRMMPFSHALLERLIGSLRIDNDSEVDKLRQKHAVETLGVLVFALLDRPFIDFKQQVLSLFCVMEDGDRFFARLVVELMLLVGVDVSGLQNVGKKVGETQDDNADGTSGPGSNGAHNNGAHNGKQIEPLALYIRLLALSFFLTLVTACDNLDRNPILDHFSVQSTELLLLFDSVLKADRPLCQKERAFSLLALLCNHRKHESRNPFRARFRAAEVNDMHLYLFSLCDCMAGINALLVKCTKEQAGRGSLLGVNGAISQDAIAELVESASETVIAFGAQMGSAFGAWVSGIDPSKTKSQNGNITTSDQDRTNVLLPVLSTSSDGSNPKYLDAALWLRARFLLLGAYELLCGTGGERWIKVLTEHDVPPWALAGGMRGNGGGVPQPLECSQVFLELLKLLSFCLHSNAQRNGLPTLSAHMALFIVRCLTENPQAGTLLFAVRLEETANVEDLELFEREHCRRDGKLCCIKASDVPCSSSSSSAPLQRRKSSAALGDGQEMAAMRMRSQSANMSLLSKSLASMLIRQLSLLLIEHSSSPMHGAVPPVDRSAPGDASAGSLPAQPTDKSAARRDNSRPGALCSRIIECLHRLLLFEKRTQNRDTSSLLGVDWSLVTRALFSLMGALTQPPGPGSLLFDLDSRSHTDLCAHLIHIFNLVLSSDCQGDMERFLFIYQILSHRKEIEAFGSTIDKLAVGPANGNDKSSTRKGTASATTAASAASLPGKDNGARVVQQSMSNLRTILFHFSQAVMMMESATASSGPGGSSEDKVAAQARTSHIMTKLAESAPTLKLRPHDRLLDGFQRFAETREERTILREFIAELCKDTKASRLFSNSIKKNV